MPHTPKESEKQTERGRGPDARAFGPRRSKRHQKYVDGPALRFALWRRIRARLVWVLLGLVILGISILGPRLIGLPHLFLAISSLPVLALALVGLPHLLRDPLVRTVVVREGRGSDADGRGSMGPTLPPAVTAREFAPTFALVTGTGFTDGNRVDVLTNGDGTFERFWSDLRGARHSITVQMYYLGPGLVADTTIEILVERARAGVNVYFLYDAFGAEDLPKRFFDPLRAAPVHIAEFRPVRWYALDNASHRLHVRAFVIDGRIGYTGGFGLDDKWLGDGRSLGEWRETNVRFVGPAVSQLQAGFVADWATATGKLIISETLLCGPWAEDVITESVTAAVIHSPPLMGSTAAERLLAFAISSARRTLYISNSYFVPTRDFTRLLVEAAQRDVDVRVLTNGGQSDVRTTWLAGRSGYEPLLRAGVRIFEYQTTIHAKTFVVDGELSAVTTMNFDNRSLAYNNEVGLVTLDGNVGAHMDSLFLDDVQYSDEILLERFQMRSPGMRMLERLASVGSRML